MPERSAYQKKVIERYYENLDAIMLAKVQELVSELYLADSDKKRERLWDRVRRALVKLKIKPALIEHIMSKRDPKVLALNLEDWLKAAARPRRR
jgi:hypothetical protein